MNPTNFTTAVVCHSCGLVNDFRVVEKANNRMAYCTGCNAFIKNLPYKEPMLYVGKYKGKPIKDIEDLSYLEWAFNSMKLSENIRNAIQDRIRALQLTHR